MCKLCTLDTRNSRQGSCCLDNGFRHMFLVPRRQFLSRDTLPARFFQPRTLMLMHGKRFAIAICMSDSQLGRFPQIGRFPQMGRFSKLGRLFHPFHQMGRFFSQLGRLSNVISTNGPNAMLSVTFSRVIVTKS